MRYFTADEILAIHNRILEATKGLPGVRDYGLLFSIAERPKTNLMGQEMFLSVFDKAAVSLEALATYHVFADGNKRTAISTAAAFLAMNGYRLDPDDMTAYRFVRAVAMKKKTIKYIAAWLKKYSKPL